MDSDPKGPFCERMCRPSQPVPGVDVDFEQIDAEEEAGPLGRGEGWWSDQLLHTAGAIVEGVVKDGRGYLP